MMTTQTEADDVESLVDDFFGELYGLTGRSPAERNRWSDESWNATTALGLSLVGIDERVGGSGGTLQDTLRVLRGAGRHCVPLPLVETWLAAWLLAQAGIEVPDAPLTVMTDTGNLVISDGRLSGHTGDVAWAAEATSVIGVVDAPNGSCELVRLSPAHFTGPVTTDLAGVRHTSIVLEAVEVEHHPISIQSDAVFVRGALLTAAMMAGAIENLLELTNRYVSERSQFGKPIGAFQSVQLHTVTLAEAAIAARLVVEAAAAPTELGAAEFEALAAKSLVNEHARAAARASHQAHGAIGMTQEHPLHHLTRRLSTWRGAFGDELTLNSRLGEYALRARTVLIDATSSVSIGA